MKFVLGASKPGDEQCLDGTSSKQTVELQAHRVVVASRCDWFRRALLSGMKESINRYLFLLTYSYFRLLTLVLYMCIEEALIGRLKVGFSFILLL